MQYVIDASVVVKWFLPEPYSDKADILLKTFRVQRLELTAPDLIVPEVGNALWKRSTLTEELSASQAEQSYRYFLELQIPLQSSSALAEEALKLAAQERHPIYDALYIALAARRGCQLITADEKLMNKLGSKFPLVRWLGDT